MSVLDALLDYETAEVVQILHERGTKQLARLKCVDGGSVYGVLESGKIEFLGTKAEAKRVYGTWRSDGR